MERDTACRTFLHLSQYVCYCLSLRVPGKGAPLCSLTGSPRTGILRHQSHWPSDGILFIHSFIYLFIQPFIHSFIHSFYHSFIHSFVHSFIHLSIYSFIHSLTNSFIHPSIHLSIHWLIYFFIHSFIHLFFHPFFYLFIHSSIHPFIHWSIHPFIHSSIHSSIHPLIHPSIHPFIHPFIHPSIHPFIYVCSTPQNGALLHTHRQNTRSPSTKPRTDWRPTYSGVRPSSPRRSLQHCSLYPSAIQPSARYLPPWLR